MANTSHFSFSAPGSYRFKIFGKGLVHNFAMESFQIINTQKITEGFIIDAERTVRDQAHLIGIINMLNNLHFMILNIERKILE